MVDDERQGPPPIPLPYLEHELLIFSQCKRPESRPLADSRIARNGHQSRPVHRLHSQFLFGRPLEVTETGFADEIAAAASLVMGQANEAMPLVLVRGLHWTAPEANGAALVRPPEHDLFR